MSFEGLWAIRFGHKGEAGLPNGGVVVFETNRVFGGDSWIAYTGRYELQEGKRVVANVTAEQHSPGIVYDAWGGMGGKFDMLVVAEMQADGEWSGVMGREGDTDKLNIRMRKLSELP